MREWNLRSGDPLSLTLAADARLGPTDYCNDQIWELSLRTGEPPALVLQTTYGLRARSLRIFPRFTEGDLTRSDPETFAAPPIVKQFAPNFIRVKFTPFSGMEIIGEYWIPESHASAGRYIITNRSNTPRKFTLELIGLLTPNGEGQRMVPTQVSGSNLLSGLSGGLAPVIFLTGGAEAGTGPFPSLELQISLHPGETKIIIWSQAALHSVDASFELAHKTANTNWEAAIARIDLYISGLIEIYTGDPDWDAAFALSQKVAYELFLGPSSQLPNQSFVYARQPEHGFSLRGDGLDYNHLWNGQTPLDTWYLAGLLLPAAPHLMQGILANFFAIASDNGFIDWKPGLAGQRGKLLATPLLASLVLRVYEYTKDLTFLKDNFPILLAYFKIWFSSAHDRDSDGIPEWSHSLHSGYDDHPQFGLWPTWSQGAEISTAETPALSSFLYREAQSLLRIADLVEDKTPVEELETTANILRTAVEIAWDKTGTIYRNWDRDSHFSTKADRIALYHGSGQVNINRGFDQPVRLLIKIKTETNPPPRPLIFVHGIGPNGQHLVERINPEHFHWQPNYGSVTGGRVYAKLEFISIEGLGEEDIVELSTVDYQGEDHTLLLPLWAGIPAAERVSALVEKTITNPDRFWKPFGIPACPKTLPGDDTEITHMIHLVWNTLIGEGLVKYGYRKEAAELVERVMPAIIESLKKESAFRKYYHAQTGKGRGEANSLEGLAPVGLFLETLGVYVFSAQRVGISGFNPFPWPITVKYRGLSILRESDKTTVVFPDGQTSTITEPDPCYVLLD